MPEHPSAPSHPRFVGAQFIFLALVWGSSFLFIRVALEGLNPVQLVFGRVGLGALLLVAIMVATRRRWPRGLRAWGMIGLSSIFVQFIPFMLYSWAGQFVPSSLSAIYNASVPIMTILAALMILPNERLTGSRVAALFVGLGGVVLLAAPWTLLASSGASATGDGAPILLAHLACLGANISYGIGYAVTRRMLNSAPHDSIVFAASQLVVSTALTLAVLPFLGGFAPIRLTPEVVGSILGLGLLGSGLAYIAHLGVLRAWGAARSSTVTYLTPIVGVVLGVLLLGEPLHWNEPLGGVIILIGVIISQGQLPRFGRAR